MRARDLGINLGSLPTGACNAITDVHGVRVGHATVTQGDDVRTGVTVVAPHPAGVPLWQPVFAGVHTLSGNGELTGLAWLCDSGLLTSPIALTNTFSVGVVRDTLVHLVRGSGPNPPAWLMPVVGETYDGVLSDIEGAHVRPEHVDEALEAAVGGSVPEGNVGAGTGTVCHGFKGGIGTASRLVDEVRGARVGVLVQANQGRRERLAIGGVPVGRLIPPEQVAVPAEPEGAGSIIAVVATDAPLLPHQCSAVARRASLGIARVGGTGESSSGDLIVAFATGNHLDAGEAPEGVPARVLSPGALDPIFDATVEATEEAIVNALLAAETTRGRNGTVAHALDGQQVRRLMARLTISENVTETIDRDVGNL